MSALEDAQRRLSAQAAAEGARMRAALAHVSAPPGASSMLLSPSFFLGDSDDDSDDGAELPPLPLGLFDSPAAPAPATAATSPQLDLAFLAAAASSPLTQSPAIGAAAAAAAVAAGAAAFPAAYVDIQQDSIVRAAPPSEKRLRVFPPTGCESGIGAAATSSLSETDVSEKADKTDMQVEPRGEEDGKALGVGEQVGDEKKDKGRDETGGTAEDARKRRQAAIVRFRAKKLATRARPRRRLIRYDCRKVLAHKRPRVKGRFVRLDDSAPRHTAADP